MKENVNLGQADICVIHFLFRMTCKKEMLYRFCFWTLFWNRSFRTSK